MKLLLCPDCQDILRLYRQKTRRCLCGASAGMYVDGKEAVYYGKAIPIGFSNPSFIRALANRPEDGLGSRFVAFVIPLTVQNITYEPIRTEAPGESGAEAEATE